MHLPPLRTRLLAPALLAGLVAALAGCSDHNAVDPASGNPKDYIYSQGLTYLSPGSRPVAPDVSGTLLDGRRFQLSSWSGHVVVVNFWGSWCAPCRAEAATLEAVATATAPAGVRFLGVDVKDDAASARAFDAAKHVTYPSIEDQQESIAVTFRDLPPSAIPTTVIIDRHGRVAARLSGEAAYLPLLGLVRRVVAEPT